MTIRELDREDLALFPSFYETLNGLSVSPPLSDEQTISILEKNIKTNRHTFVVIREHQVIATATVILEQKFLRGGAICAHIEDVVTHRDYMHQGIASRLLQHIATFTQRMGCYKIVLYCKEELGSFYIKNGFATKGIQMERRWV